MKEEGNSGALDLFRGMAAILVMVGHARSFVLVDFPDVLHKDNLALKALYFVTSLGHSAVMVFFVLSGFLITRSIVQAEKHGTWTWHRYAVQRLARLWVVLLPCLLLGGLWDTLGITLTHSPFYQGLLSDVLKSAPARPGVAVDATTLLGNVIFLQTLLVPCFGSNGPLWSLCNEFWYYCLFPLLYVGWHRRNHLPTLLSCLGISGALVFGLLSKAVLLAWPCWLAGSIVVWLHQRRVLVRVLGHPVGAGGSVILFVITLAVGKLGVLSPILSDYLVTFGFSALLMSGLYWQRRNARPIMLFSGMSYSLYLSHFPILAFLSAFLYRNERIPPNEHGLAVLGAAIIVALIWGWFVWLLFERQTPRVRQLLLRLVKMTDVRSSREFF